MNRFLLMVLALAPLLLTAAAAPQPPDGPGAQLPVTVVNLKQRLSALTPADPLAYFILAEDLSAEADDKPSRDLARTLFVLTFDLYRTRNQPGDGEMARSAALGLASLTHNDGERRWLAAVGDQVAPATDKAAAASARLPSAVSEATSFNLATAIGLARSGDGRRAEQYLGREGVRELLTATQGTIAGGPTAGGGGVLKWVEDWPVCPTCKNRRVLTRGTESFLCPYCDGNPGPKLTDQQLLVQYRAESLLLKGAYRSWSAQLLADDGEALRDPNAGDVAVSFGVDTRATLWRDGAWIAP